jgi:GxxExxY protein
LADIVVENLVILELKVAEEVTKAHEGQLGHYLWSSRMEVGLVLAFGSKARFSRSMVTNDRKLNLRI